MQFEEAELINQLRSESESEANMAFEKIFLTYYEPLVRFAVQYVGSVAIAEDVVGEWFAHMWERRKNVKPSTSVGAYLFGAVRNKAISAHRNAQRKDPALAPMLAAGEFWGMGVPTPAADLELLNQDRKLKVWHAVASLPERQREIMVLRWQFSKGWDEISSILGVTISAAQMQHTRAVKLLRERLSDFFV